MASDETHHDGIPEVFFPVDNQSREQFEEHVHLWTTHSVSTKQQECEYATLHIYYSRAVLILILPPNAISDGSCLLIETTGMLHNE